MQASQRLLYFTRVSPLTVYISIDNNNCRLLLELNIILENIMNLKWVNKIDGAQITPSK